MLERKPEKGEVWEGRGQGDRGEEMRNVLFTLKVISDVVFKMKNDKNSESIL